MNESCGVEDSSAISTKIHGMFSDRAPELSRIQRIEKLGMSEIILQYEAETKKKQRREAQKERSHYDDSI